MPTKEEPLLSIGKLILLTFGLALGVFVDILDTSIANVAIPYITGNLGAAPASGTWIITSYAISNAIIIPLAGRLAYRFEESRIFIASMLLFSLFSAACAVAWNLSSLVFFRVFQGFTGGALLPLCQGLIVRIYPLRYQSLAMGMLFAVMVIAPILGPILGGWLVDNFHWPAIFYISVPFGLLSAALILATLGFGQHKIIHKKYDFIGFFLLVIMVGALQICLDKGHDLGWFHSNLIIVLALTSFIATVFFIIWNIYNEDPLVDFSFLKNTNFSIGTLIISLGISMIFGGTVLLPLWLQIQKGYSAVMAGLSVAPLGLAPLLLGAPMGYWMNKVDARWLASTGLIIISLSFFWFASFNTEVTLQQLLFSRSIQGIGIAFFMLPITTISLSEIPKHKYVEAASLFHFIRIIISCGFAVALFSDAWQSWEHYYHSHFTEVLSPFALPTREALHILTSMGLKELSAVDLLNDLAIHQASLLSLNDIFWFSGWLSLLLFPFVWLCRYKPSLEVSFHA